MDKFISGKGTVLCLTSKKEAAISSGCGDFFAAPLFE